MEDRRSFIRAMAFAAGAPFALSSAQKSNSNAHSSHGFPTTTARGLGEPGTLNVIFHGVFGFMETKESIDMLIPNLQTEHVYRAGNWLGEAELGPGLYSLEGVTPGDASFNREHNIVVDGLSLSRDPKRQPYATLRFPRPRKIASLMRLKASELMENRSKLRLHMNEVPTLQVFSYSFPTENGLRLKGHFWEPTFAGETINLHVFSGPDGPRSMAHVNRAFTAQAQMFEGLDLAMKHGASERIRLERDELPSGITVEETEGLTPRTRRLARLGRLRKQGRSLDELWDDTRALDGSDPGTCTHCGAGGCKV